MYSSRVGCVVLLPPQVVTSIDTRWIAGGFTLTASQPWRDFLPWRFWNAEHNGTVSEPTVTTAMSGRIPCWWLANLRVHVFKQLHSGFDDEYSAGPCHSKARRHGLDTRNKFDFYFKVADFTCIQALLGRANSLSTDG